MLRYIDGVMMDVWYKGHVQQVRSGGLMCIRYDADYAGQPLRQRTFWHDMHDTTWRVPRDAS